MLMRAEGDTCFLGLGNQQVHRVKKVSLERRSTSSDRPFQINSGDIASKKTTLGKELPRGKNLEVEGGTGEGRTSVLGHKRGPRALMNKKVRNVHASCEGGGSLLPPQVGRKNQKN